MRMFITAIALLAFLAAPAFARSSASGGPMPACSASDPVVWVNTKSNVYHLRGDKYFGNTKAGKYACQSQAAAMGAHAGKGHAKGAHGAMGEDNGSMQGSATGVKHKKHHGEGATPAPAAT